MNRSGLVQNWIGKDKLDWAMAAKKQKSTANHNPTGVQSIARAIGLLRAVAQHNQSGARLSQLAREVELHVATARRVLQSLASEGLIAYDPVGKLYHLGLELYRLGHQARQYAIRTRFRQSLEAIAQATQDTVFLLIRLGNDAVCLDMVEGEYPIRTMLINVGFRRPLGVGAGSLALITFDPNVDMDRVLGENEPRLAEYEQLDLKRIRAMATEARQRGYVHSDALFHKDAVSVGVPVFDQAGRVICAITVSAIRSRMDPARRELIYEVVRQHTRPEIIGLCLEPDPDSDQD